MTGGQKIGARHVQTLRELGYDAVVRAVGDASVSPLLSVLGPGHLVDTIGETDILVVPEDLTAVLKAHHDAPNLKVVQVLNQFYASISGLASLTDAERAGYRTYLACSYSAANWVATYLPHDDVAVIPGFADERVFKPGAAKRAIIACAPRKRQSEYKAIRFMFERGYKGRLDWRWAVLQGATEPQVAQAFADCAVYLSLSRLESLGMTTLEAMACGCIVAGFTGVGGTEYSTPANGYWAGEDDCEAAAEALLKAVSAAEAGGAAAALRREAGLRTAREWSYDHCSQALQRFWAPRANRAA